MGQGQFARLYNSPAVNVPPLSVRHVFGQQSGRGGAVDRLFPVPFVVEPLASLHDVGDGQGQYQGIRFTKHSSDTACETLSAVREPIGGRVGNAQDAAATAGSPEMIFPTSFTETVDPTPIRAPPDGLGQRRQRLDLAHQPRHVAQAQGALQAVHVQRRPSAFRAGAGPCGIVALDSMRIASGEHNSGFTLHCVITCSSSMVSESSGHTIHRQQLAQLVDGNDLVLQNKLAVQQRDDHWGIS